MIEYNTDLQILKDVSSTGKERPWKERKMESLLIADSLGRIGLDGQAFRMRNCANYLKFEEAVDSSTGEILGKRLAYASFCRGRFCPMCCWRKSRLMWFQMSDALDWIQNKYPHLVPIFLTLTVRNVSADELASTIEKMLRVGFKNMIDHRKIRRIMVGWFRALEVTYSRKRNNFHPHLHCIILVDESYFKGTDYMHTTDWVQMWRMCMKLDYDPICDVRKLKNENSAERGKSVAEAAKYTVKPGEWITKDKDLTDRVVLALHNSLAGRRVVGYGGVIREARKILKQEDIETADLVQGGEEKSNLWLRSDIKKVVSQYNWQMGVTNYIKKS